MTDFEPRRSNASPLRSSPRRSDSPGRPSVDEILAQARAQRTQQPAISPRMPSSQSTILADGQPEHDSFINRGQRGQPRTMVTQTLMKNSAAKMHRQDFVREHTTEGIARANR